MDPVMGDKYAHLRPSKARHCYRADGIPKKRYTRAAARAQAVLNDGYHAYRCPNCGTWHVGAKPNDQEGNQVMNDPRVALWYHRLGGVYVDIEASEEDAAESAYWMERDGAASVNGVQYPDGRFLPIEELAIYREVSERHAREEREVAAQAAQRPPLPTRTVRVPWDEDRTLTVAATLPSWIGREQSG
jgi:hypothetical protein